MKLNSRHLYVETWHPISPSELLQRGLKMAQVDFNVNHLSRFTYEPFLLPSHDFVSYTTFSSGNVVFHGLKQKSRRGKYHWRRTNGEHYSDEIEGRGFYNYALLRRLNFSFRRKNHVFSRIVITMIFMMIMMMMMRMRMIYQGQGLNNFAEQLV